MEFRCKGTKIIRQYSFVDRFFRNIIRSIQKKVVTLHPHFRKIRGIRHRLARS